MATKIEPYVGPRPFERTDTSIFFGRDREANDLRSLVTSSAAVLLYAQSGAGKTSLLNARLIPLLEKAEMEVLLPTARVRGKLPEGLDLNQIAGANIYVFNALAGWKGKDAEPASLAQKTLAQFLEARPRRLDDEELPLPRVLIFDQFEELFTFYPDRWKDRRGFFEQVSEALENDRLLRVVFSMREDYIAELDPYLSLLPENLSTRYRLERLREESALSAVENPLLDTHLHFAPGVARHLVKNLLTIPVKNPTGISEVEGEFVEPVQLQVVCKALWNKVQSTNETLITEERLRNYGDVNKALRAYYEKSIQKVVEETSVKEGFLRRWFENVLITPAGTRGTVFRGPSTTGGLDNAAIDVLDNQHLIRAELRGGERWYELSHDRFIQPIKESNKDWALQHSSAEEMRKRLEEKAALWRTRRPGVSALLDIGELLEAEHWLESPEAAEIGCDEAIASFVQISRMAIDAKEATHLRLEEKAKKWRQGSGQLLVGEELLEAARLIDSPVKTSKDLQDFVNASRATSQQKRLRTYGVGLAVLAVLLILLLGLTSFAIYQMRRADRALTAAHQARDEAEAQRNEALQAQAEAEKQRKYAQESLAKEQALKKELEKEKKEAEDQRDIADQQRAVAVEEKRKAEDAKRRTELALVEAQHARADAVEQKRLAEAATDLANEQTRLARAAENKATTQAGIAATQQAEAEKAKAEAVQAKEEAEKNLEAVEEKQRVIEAVDKTPPYSLQSLREYQDPVRTAVFSSDKKHFVTASGDGSAIVWEWDERKPEEKPKRLRILSDHQASDVDKDDKVTSPLNDMPYSALAALSADGKRIATTGVHHDVLIWGEENRPQYVLVEPESLSDSINSMRKILLSPNGEFVAAVSEASAFDPDGGGGPLIIWDLSKCQNNPDSCLPAFLISGEQRFMNAAFSPDGERIVTAGKEGTAQIWEWRKCQTESGCHPFKELRGHNGIVNDAEFSRDGKSVVTAGDDGTIIVWDVLSGKRKQTLREHTGVLFRRAPGSYFVFRINKLQKNFPRINSAVFSPDGHFVLSTSADQMARIWDINTGTPVRTFRGHAASVLGGEFSPDGSSVITASEDRTVRLWDACKEKDERDLDVIDRSARERLCLMKACGRKKEQCSDKGKPEK